MKFLLLTLVLTSNDLSQEIGYYDSQEACDKARREWVGNTNAVHDSKKSRAFVLIDYRPGNQQMIYKEAQCTASE